LRTLGIDPGSRVTGYGVVEGEGSRLVCLGCGTIRPRPGALVDRLGEIHRGVALLIERHAPDQVVFEAVFAAKNVRSALVLGQARGAALAACGSAGCQVAEYTPAEVKTAVAGNGRAGKDQIQHMVKLLLGLSERPVTDAADALAVAICHLQQAPMRAALAAAEAREQGASSAGATTGAARAGAAKPERGVPRPRSRSSADWRFR